MLRSDLLFTRGSPNTLTEAITMTIPVVITGPLLAQEKSNPRLMQDYHLGVVCRSPADAPAIIRSLLYSNGRQLREIRAAQQAFRSFDSARNIALYVAELAGSCSQRSSLPEM